MTDTKYVTIVGSRNILIDKYIELKNIALNYAKKGYRLRSGGAKGSDTAAEEGYIGFNNKEIYLIRPRFKMQGEIVAPLLDNWEEAIKILKETIDVNHFNNLNGIGLQLHSRNVYQVLGRYLNRPSDEMYCYTEGGKDIGGTRTAILLARRYNINICNIG